MELYYSIQSTGLAVVKIDEVMEHSAVYKDGRLQKGDVVLRVNGVSVQGMSCDRVMQLLDCNRSVVQVCIENIGE